MVFHGAETPSDSDPKKKKKKRDDDPERKKKKKDKKKKKVGEVTVHVGEEKRRLNIVKCE